MVNVGQFVNVLQAIYMVHAGATTYAHVAAPSMSNPRLNPQAIYVTCPGCHTASLLVSPSNFLLTPPPPQKTH